MRDSDAIGSLDFGAGVYPAPTPCIGDRTGTQTVGVNDLFTLVNNALNGCGVG